MLALTVVMVAQSHRLAQVTILGLRYPGSFYLLVDLCLIASIVCLVPAIRLRMKMARMQVSDDGPLLGATTMTIEDDGLRFDRPGVSAKYKWEASQGVELAKDAIILPIDNGIGLIVPASAFPSQAAPS